MDVYPYLSAATPARPYGGFTTDLRLVEANMEFRRKMIEMLLGSDERLMTMSTFPLMGVGNFVEGPPLPVHGPVYDSLYLPDQIISPHPRFAYVARARPDPTRPVHAF